MKDERISPFAWCYAQSLCWHFGPQGDWSKWRKRQRGQRAKAPWRRRRSGRRPVRLRPGRRGAKPRQRRRLVRLRLSRMARAGAARHALVKKRLAPESRTRPRNTLPSALLWAITLSCAFVAYCTIESDRHLLSRVDSQSGNHLEERGDRGISGDEACGPKARQVPYINARRTSIGFP